MEIRKLYLIWPIIIIILIGSCIEPYDAKTYTFEDTLVIEATITNEFKHHEIYLTRTFQLEEDGPIAETAADVKIFDDLQNTYTFQETTPGKYVSDDIFSANPNKSYQLIIVTSRGKSYASKPTQLTNITQIDNVHAFKEINDDGLEGVIITVNSFDSTGKAKYYRYEYEETYKIIAQYWSRYEAIVISDIPPYEVDFKLKSKEDKVCYNTITSKGIIQTETNNLTEDRVTNFPIRFILEDDFVIRHRYSILIKQYVQSQEAYSFYKIFNELSESESLFSQNQPGFINGNLYSIDNENEKVIGFFQVSSVSSKRIFINQQDLISKGQQLLRCHLEAPELENSIGESPLIESIESGRLRFFVENNGTSIEPIEGGPFVMVNAECADCTIIGSNIVPDFWIE